MNQETKSASSVHRITASFTENSFHLIFSAVRDKSVSAVCRYDDWAMNKNSIIRAGMDEVDYYATLTKLAHQSNELHELYLELRGVIDSYRADKS